MNKQPAPHPGKGISPESFELRILATPESGDLLLPQLPPAPVAWADVRCTPGRRPEVTRIQLRGP